jgi:hypothetical protein
MAATRRPTITLEFSSRESPFATKSLNDGADALRKVAAQEGTLLAVETTVKYLENMAQEVEEQLPSARSGNP